MDDRSYAMQIEYLNTTNSRNTQIIQLPGKNKIIKIDVFSSFYADY